MASRASRAVSRCSQIWAGTQSYQLGLHRLVLSSSVNTRSIRSGSHSAFAKSNFRSYSTSTPEPYKPILTPLNTGPAPEPLNILFFGSDNFSAHVLRSLHLWAESHPQTISNISVGSRPPKRTGRGLKNLTVSPFVETAKEIGVREVIELDTLTGWSLPSHINLIIAVSYGLFIPARILNQAKYRGLNLHPSLLPDYRGSSPIQSAIINRDTDTGVTLQDLSAKAFDRGKILARVHLPIQNAETVTTAQLVEQVSQPAADLLIAGLEAGLYQHERTQALPPPELDHEPRDARKFAKDDMQLRHGMSALEAGARRRALGSLWFARSALSPKKKVVEQRVLLDDVCVVPAMAEGKRRKVDVIEKVGEGEDVCWSCEAFEHGDSVDLHLEGGKALRVRRATVSGQKQASGREVI